MIVDVHVHPVSRDLVRDPRNLRMMERDAVCLAREDAVSLLIERMDRAGVDRACLMGPTAGDGIALTNDMVRAAVARHPGRLIGFAGVDSIADDPGRVREVVLEAIDEWGFRGVGELCGDLLDARYEPIYRLCAERQVPLLVHVGIPLPSMLLKHGQPVVLDELANRHPELTIIAAHVGMPWFPETIAIAVRHPNVYLDVSAIPMLGRDVVVHGVLGLLWERGLEDRVLFGTDFPLVDPARYLPVLRRGPGWLARRLTRFPRMTAAMRDKLLGGNAARLLKLDERGEDTA